MPEHSDLLQQIFQQNGLIGLLLGFLILGPGFTYFKTRNLQSRVEAKAQDLVNEFAKLERQRADRLEQQLNTALAKLNNAEVEVIEMKNIIAQNAQALEDLPKLRQQVQQLTQRVAELEALSAYKDQELARKDEHIQTLEQTLLDRRLPQIQVKPPVTTPDNL